MGIYARFSFQSGSNMSCPENLDPETTSLEKMEVVGVDTTPPRID